MILVMHWAVKSLRKQRLLQARSISLSVDDRKEYRVLRYRCHVPAPSSKFKEPTCLDDWCGLDTLAFDGLLGVYRVGSSHLDSTVASYDTDKSEAMAKTIHLMVERSLTDAEGSVDAADVERVLENIRHFASDQGPSVQKAAKVLASDGKLPNLAYVSFDAAHQLRIASKDPLSALPAFEQQWQRLFGGGHALLPAIQFSKIWQAKLTACQEAILQAHGSQGGIRRAIESIGYAAHRWDSTASPLLKYCSMIRAIALLCGMQAADATQTNFENNS